MFFGFGGVTNEKVDFGWAFVALVVFNVFFPIEFKMGESFLDELLYGVRLVGSDDVVIRGVLLEHQPHHFGILFRVAPVAFCFQVAQVEFVLDSGFDACGSTRDLSCDKCFTAARRLMVEEDAAAAMEPKGFAIVDREPVSVYFGAGVRRTWPERGGFYLGYFLHFPKHFRGGGLVVANFLNETCFPNGF